MRLVTDIDQDINKRCKNKNCTGAFNVLGDGSIRYNCDNPSMCNVIKCLEQYSADLKKELTDLQQNNTIKNECIDCNSCDEIKKLQAQLKCIAKERDDISSKRQTDLYHFAGIQNKNDLLRSENNNLRISLKSSRALNEAYKDDLEQLNNKLKSNKEKDDAYERQFKKSIYNMDFLKARHKDRLCFVFPFPKSGIHTGFVDGYILKIHQSNIEHIFKIKKHLGHENTDLTIFERDGRFYPHIV